jgi:N-acetylneuraminic acid mutarotase
MFKPAKAIFGHVLLVFLAGFSLAVGQSTPPADQSSPADQPKPAAEQAKPAEEEAKPAADDAKPATEQPKPEARGPRLPSLPVPVTGNAVAVLRSRGANLMFSLMGMGAKKTWDAVTNTGFYLDADWDQWYPVKSVPGTAGRIDASAIGARGSLFLFGGTVVDDHNRGLVVPDVNIYAPATQTWSRGNDMPTPVADFVIGVYRDRYIYILGGRSNNRAVADVQIYDAEKSRWMPGTPLPGHPVFGHAGALLEDTIVFVDGAYKNPSPTGPPVLASDECWMGKIDRRDPSRIEWSKLPAHPGSARFGIAAGAAERDRKIYFTGGSDNPHADTGLGFDGHPSEPSPMTFAWNLRAAKWEVVNEATPNPAMNNRGLLVIPDMLVVAGGMEKGQSVTRRVVVLPDVAKTR